MQGQEPAKSQGGTALCDWLFGFILYINIIIIIFSFLMSQKIVQNDYFAGLHGLKNFNDAQLFMPFLQSNCAKLCAAAIEDGACNLWETTVP